MRNNSRTTAFVLFVFILNLFIFSGCGSNEKLAEEKPAEKVAQSSESKTEPENALRSKETSKPKSSKKDDSSSKDKGKPEKKAAEKEPPVPPLAELIMIKLRQHTINRGTTKLDRTRRRKAAELKIAYEKIQWTKKDKFKLKTLAKEQRRLLKFLEGLVGKMKRLNLNTGKEFPIVFAIHLKLMRKSLEALEKMDTGRATRRHQRRIISEFEKLIRLSCVAPKLANR